VLMLAGVWLVYMGKRWDLWKTPSFTQFMRLAQILILKILNVFLPAP